MRSNIGGLYPAIYRGIRETDGLIQAEDAQFDRWFGEMDRARDNQLVLTADALGIGAFEKLLGISGASAEDLEFRRQRVLNRLRMKPPFTMPFLRERLDELIGAGRYKAWISMGDHNYRLGEWELGRLPFRQHTHTLHVETTVPDAAWYHEVQVFVNRIKPANIVYALYPLVASGVQMGEAVHTTNTKWNYRLNGMWRLSEASFSVPGEREAVKLAGTKSLTSSFLEHHARFTAEDITGVLLNDEVEVTAFQQKEAEGTDTVLRYVVPEGSGITEITNIKLLDSGGAVLSSSDVYIPMTDLVTLQHTITHKEETQNG